MPRLIYQITWPSQWLSQVEFLAWNLILKDIFHIHLFCYFFCLKTGSLVYNCLISFKIVGGELVESRRKSQSATFLEGEGDAWFSRNQQQLEYSDTPSIDVDFICESLKPFRGSVQNILEIGCGSAKKLSQLTSHFEASGFGLDPSLMAINKAKEITQLQDSKLNFEVGLATDLPYSDGQFDLVFFGFCLYLIPPIETYKAIMEANRVLKCGGFLAILDFDYGRLKINPYKHAEGVFTHKNNYSQMFTSSGYYSILSKWSFNLTSDFFSLDREERVSIEVLYKEVL